MRALVLPVRPSDFIPGIAPSCLIGPLGAIIVMSKLIPTLASIRSLSYFRSQQFEVFSLFSILLPWFPPDSSHSNYSHFRAGPVDRLGRRCVSQSGFDAN